MSIKLGDKAKDKISGFKGIVTAKSEYLNGCTRILIESMGLQESGIPVEAQWFDDVQVETIKSGAFAGKVPPAAFCKAPPAIIVMCIGTIRAYGKNIIVPILGFCLFSHFLL